MKPEVIILAVLTCICTSCSLLGSKTPTMKSVTEHHSVDGAVTTTTTEVPYVAPPTVQETSHAEATVKLFAE